MSLDKREFLDPKPPASSKEQLPVEDLRALMKAWAFVHPDVPDELSLMMDDLGSMLELCEFYTHHFVRTQAELDEFARIHSIHDRALKIKNSIQADLLKLTRRVAEQSRLETLH